jgi:hypothetical protein
MSDGPVDPYEALEKIRQITAIHYLGAAFEPEHMRAISNYCAGVLNKESMPNDIENAPDPYFIELLRENGWKVEYVGDEEKS